MSNLTEDWRNLSEQSVFDSKTKEKTKRAMVMLQNTYNLDIRMLAEGNFDTNTFLFFNNLHAQQTKVVNRMEFNLEDKVDVLESKDLIELAFSAFGMKFHVSASKFLKEAMFSLCR